MNAHRIETILNQDGTLILKDLPFHAGNPVEVIVLQRSADKLEKKKRYPLQGTSIRYQDPTKPVAESDWDVNR